MGERKAWFVARIALGWAHRAARLVAGAIHLHIDASRSIGREQSSLEVQGMRTDIVLEGLDPRVSPRLPSR